MEQLASVVIPAHDEERGIARTLRALYDDIEPERLDVVVVCNGCSDRTAEVVRATFPWVRVLEIPEPSKIEAVAVGNAAALGYPRVHLDADVLLSGDSLRALVAPVSASTALAAGPRRVLDRGRCSRVVGWYYDVWEQLPQVRHGLFGRGVYALSETGQQRVSALPRLMSDDLAASEAFAPDERAVVDGATVVVVPARTLRDLLRRRVRVATGNAQATRTGARGDTAVTSLSTLGRLALAQPRLAWRIPVFVGVAAAAKLMSRRAVRAGDFTTWLRDESSRA